MKLDRSYGVIPLKKTNEGWLFLIIQHAAGHWDFPKGHLENNESEKEAAARELTEETGFNVIQWLDLPPATNRYHSVKDGEPVDKTVLYFLALVDGQIELSPREVIDSFWGSYETVRERLTYDNSRQVIDQVWADLNQGQHSK
jgi:8-oxo-dGTP pyrophosphatase MutT (NUDIX family)